MCGFSRIELIAVWGLLRGVAFVFPGEPPERAAIPLQDTSAPR